jgi:predicted signal transduction protein with EAL and GGDEF domain
MTFSFDPPRSLFYLVVFIVASSLLVIVVGRRSPARKAIGLVVAVVIATMLVNRLYTIRGSSVTVDDSGITADIDGRETIPWASIEQAVYVDDVSASRYAPGRPTNMLPRWEPSTRATGGTRSRTEDARSWRWNACAERAS